MKNSWLLRLKLRSNSAICLLSRSFSVSMEAKSSKRPPFGWDGREKAGSEWIEKVFERCIRIYYRIRSMVRLKASGSGSST